MPRLEMRLCLRQLLSQLCITDTLVRAVSGALTQLVTYAICICASNARQTVTGMHGFELLLQFTSCAPWNSK
jgi:hypothetical protein